MIFYSEIGLKNHHEVWNIVTNHIIVAKIRGRIATNAVVLKTTG
jgi:hypothetical protein